MRELGVRGVVRGKTVRTTVAAVESQRPADLVERQFRASAPIRLWVAYTYVKTHSGWAGSSWPSSRSAAPTLAVLRRAQPPTGLLWFAPLRAPRRLARAPFHP